MGEKSLGDLLHNTIKNMTDLERRKFTRELEKGLPIFIKDVAEKSQEKPRADNNTQGEENK